jgi:hypothetical protein
MKKRILFLAAFLIYINAINGQTISKSEAFKNEHVKITAFSFSPKNVLPEIIREYGIRRFYTMNLSNGKIGCLWQDQNNKVILLTSYKADFTGQSTIPLKNTGKGLLLSACTDEKGNIYYATSYGSSESPDGGLKFMLYKYSKEGVYIASKSHNTDKNSLDIYYVTERYMNTMRCKNGQLLMLIERLYHEGKDGLNHQGGSALLFESTELRLIKNLGQTSGHSFDNYLTTSNNGFIGADLGDNYPRGVHFHEFKSKEETVIKSSKVVYTFKTEHGTTPSYSTGMPKYPKYTEISKSGKTYYKWSNDNSTYGEIGGVVEVSDGYLIFFTGEPSPEGKSIDNFRAGNSEDPRNVGFVKISKTFNQDEKPILSNGINEKGGFYSFDGRWTVQENIGIVWLTNFKNTADQGVRHLKTIKIDEKVILLWEQTTSSGSKTNILLKVDENGKPIGSAINLGDVITLNRRDDLMVLNGKIYLAGNHLGRLTLFEFDGL